MTLPAQLERFSERSVYEALVCFEETGLLDFAGHDAELAEELVRCALVRASIHARFILSDGEIRLRVNSQGLSVAGVWMKRVLEDELSR